MRVYLIPLLLILLSTVYSATYLVEIYNPNPYDLHDFQVKINATSLNLPLPIASIQTLDGSNIPFCYEQPNLECNETYQNTTGIIWAKIPYIPAKRYTFIKVIVNYSNGAVHGDQVFDFYDDFRSLDKWVVVRDGGSISITTLDGVTGVRLYATSYWTRIAANFIINHDVYIESRVKPIINAEAFELSILKSDEYSSYGQPRSAYGFTWNGWPYTSDRQRIRYWSNYDGQHFVSTTSNGLLQSNQWYIVGAIINLPYLAQLENGEILQRGTSTLYTYPFIQISIGDWGNPDSNADSDYFVDWIRVRKYADQDPRAIASFPATEQINTPQKQETEYQFNYLYVLPLDIISNKFVSQTYTTLPIIVNTQKFISDGIMKSDCSDIAITLYDPTTDTEQDLPFWLDPATCNTPNTVIYVKLPVYAISQDAKLFIYFGAPNAVPMSSPNAFYYFVDFSNPSDYSKIQIYTNGTASYNITSNGIRISIGNNGQLVIYNK